MKVKKILKWSALSIGALIVSLIGFGYWFIGLIPPFSETVTSTVPNDLVYLTQDSIESRGKILAVVTSCDVMGESGKSTGYELTELARAYYVFQANGFEVDIASPKGGEPPVIIDDEDMGAYDYAFLNDPNAQLKATNTISMDQVNPDDYAAVYFVGGKGAMFDFPNNQVIQSMVGRYFQSGKTIGAVCHGPAALVNATTDDGSHVLSNKTISSFTNNEELFLIPEAATIFPFLLEDKLIERGALFDEGFRYLENVSHDGNLVTGQNPWSTWKVAEKMIEQLGHQPKARAITSEENAVSILVTFETQGYGSAKNHMKQLYTSGQLDLGRLLIAKHSIISAMEWKLLKTIQLIRLVAYAKQMEVS